MTDAASMIKLYSQKILEIASNLPISDPLDNPDGVATKRSPLCGSNISVELQLNDGKISAFHQDVKACALGQTSASIFSKKAIGLNLETIKKGRDQLFEMLANEGDAPEPPFDELHVLEAAREYRNRHASILLVFDASIDAFENAQKAA